MDHHQKVLENAGLSLIIFVACAKSPEASLMAANLLEAYAKRKHVSGLIFEAVLPGTLYITIGRLEVQPIPCNACKCLLTWFIISRAV